MKFEWDDGNLDHIAEHKVNSRQAEEVFYGDPFELEDNTIDGEIRCAIVGETEDNPPRMLKVVYTLREESLRVVTAHDTNDKDSIRYREHKARRARNR